MSDLMARLNEPAAPEESVDTLKRKFFRQNRDIARANSSQSLRIRTLENEVSRLLTENLTLRSQIFRLQNELESRQSQQIVDNVGHIKAQLESKLLEIGALITGLDHVPPAVKQTSPRREKARVSIRRSLDPSRPRALCSMGELDGAEEGKLPTIMEHKQYPRRTLEREDLLRVLADPIDAISSSPDLGSPPVPQFVNEDPVKIDLPIKESEPTPTIANTTENAEPLISVNLESRRKRRDSSAVGASVGRLGSTTLLGDAAPSLKVGAKRKMAVRDESADLPAEDLCANVDDFQYTSKVGEQKVEDTAGTPKRDIAIARGSKRERAPQPVLESRKVLEPKQSNVDLTNSPKKSTKNKGKTIQDNEKDEAPVKAAVRRERRREIVNVQVKVEEPKVVEVRHEPETPAQHDLYKIPDSQPSTIRPAVRDTPPPSEFADGHRPSRRARAAVSYAEPNLRDKMRRPGKDLVDAVTGEGKARKSTSTLIQADPSVLESSGQDPLTEIPADDLKAAGENSPLSKKALQQEQRADPLASEQRPRSTEEKRKETLKRPEKSDSGYISRRIKSEELSSKPSRPSIEQAMSKLDIYDFDGTSPKRASSQVAMSGHSKRHSIASVSTARTNQDPTADMARRMANRRRQSAMNSTAVNSEQAEAEAKVSERLLKRANSNDTLTDTTAVAVSKAERIASRRRSMML